MLETPHVAVGAAIAAKIPNPFIAIPLALASHIVLDRIPHWNPHFYTETQKYGHPKRSSIIITGLDVAAALGLGLFVSYNALPDTTHAAVILLASFASVFPDLSKSPYFFLKKRNKWLVNWVKFERSLQIETNAYIGVLTQVLVIVASLMWIF